MSALNDPTSFVPAPAPPRGTEPDTGLTDAQAYTLLTGGPAALAAAMLPDADADEEPDGDDDTDADIAAEPMGAMVALVPSMSDATRLAIPGGMPADQLHVTLKYLGPATNYDLAMRADIVQAIENAVTSWYAVTAMAFGGAIWNPQGNSPVVVLQLNGDDLTALYQCVCDALMRWQPWMPEDYPEPWAAHMTLAESDKLTDLAQTLSRVGPVTLDRVRIAFAGQNADVTLTPRPPLPGEAPVLAAGGVMPYEVRKSGDCPASTPWGVFKQGTSEKMGCHASQEEAQKQMDALYANEPDAATVDSITAAPGITGGPMSPPSVGNTDQPAMVPTFSGGTPWQGILAIEGVETGDGRMFEPGSLTWTDAGLELAWTPQNFGQHDGSVMVGRIDRIYRDPANPNVIRAEGVFDDAGTNGAEMVRQMKARMAGGVSVDVDSVKDADVELVFPEGDGSDAGDGLADLFAAPELTVFHAGRIRGATMVGIPAFVEARIELVDQTAITAAPNITGAAPGNSYSDTVEKLLPHGCRNAGGPDLTACAAAISAIMTKPMRGVSLADRKAMHAHIAGHLNAMRLAPQDFSMGALSDDLQALYASASPNRAPAAPPDWMFADPGFTAATAVSVSEPDANGWQHVSGHAALWSTCHTSFPNACVTAPYEETHEYFRLGEVLTAGGERVAVGSITLGTGHAPTTGDPRRAAEHYDHTGSCVAMVASGNDDHGIWVAGVIKPGTPAGRVMELAAAKLSGDWRRFGGKLRLVAMLAVNVPGFPVPRVRAQVSDGVQVGLTAAGMLPDAAGLHALAERPALALVAASLQRRLGRDPKTRAAALRARIHPSKNQET